MEQQALLMSMDIGRVLLTGAERLAAKRTCWLT